MTTVNNSLHYLFSLAPESAKEDWDTVGLFCGHAAQPVQKALICLDPTEDAIAEAAEMGAQLLITHHPLLFHATKNASDQCFDGKKLLALIEHGIAVISMHTNLDAAPGGVNDVLADALQLQNREILHPADDVYGLGRIGTVPTQSLTDFADFAKTALHAPGLRYCDANRPVHRVAVGGGACIGFLEEVAAKGCDTFVTSDVKYHEFQHAQQLRVNLLDVSHFATENPVCAYLQSILQQQFADVRFTISASHHDIVQFA